MIARFDSYNAFVIPVSYGKCYLLCCVRVFLEHSFPLSHIHKHTRRFLGCGRHDDGDIFLVLEYCEHGSLDRFLYNTSRDEIDSSNNSDDNNNEEEEEEEDRSKRAIRSTNHEKKNIPWNLRIRLLADVADGMAYLHGVHNSVHRDLKSSNVLLTDENGVLRAKVADFGLARLIDLKKGYEKEKEIDNKQRQPHSLLKHQSSKMTAGRGTFVVCVCVFSLSLLLQHTQSNIHTSINTNRYVPLDGTRACQKYKVHGYGVQSSCGCVLVWNYMLRMSRVEGTLVR